MVYHVHTCVLFFKKWNSFWQLLFCHVEQYLFWGWPSQTTKLTWTNKKVKVSKIVNGFVIEGGVQYSKQPWLRWQNGPLGVDLFPLPGFSCFCDFFSFLRKVKDGGWGWGWVLPLGPYPRSAIVNITDLTVVSSNIYYLITGFDINHF